MKRKLNIFIACEESQACCRAFRQLGHNAYSCDLFNCSGTIFGTDKVEPHPEWHFNQDITEELTDIVVQSEGYYQAFEGYGWVGNGNVSDLFRILQYKDELILLEFFICD